MNTENASIPHIDDQIRDAKETLARIIGFIYNCDTKSGMVLAGSGVMSLILGNSGVLNKIVNVCANTNNNSWVLVAIFMLALFVCGVYFFAGIYKLSCAISAKLVCSGKNLRTYFADIAKEDLETYKQNFLHNTRQEIIEDLLEQIHVNSIVCTKKYQNYNKGLSYIRHAVGCFIPTLCFGFFIA